MNQKTAKMIKEVFGSRKEDAKKKYKELSLKGRTRARSRMKLYISSPDKKELLKPQILSDVKLEI